MSSTDIQSLVINATDFTPSKDVGYNKPRVNKAGGKAVSIVNNTTRRQLMITTPLMLTWGVNERRDESSGRVSYDMSLQFPKESYATPETTAFLEAMDAFESQIMSDAIKNSKKWFNKAKITDGQVDVLFNRMLYWPKDKETGERRADSAPTLRVKIDYWDQAFNCEIYNVDQTPLFPSKSDASLMPSDFISKGSNVACVLKCGGVYFVNGKFGVTWRLVQAVVKPRASIAGRCNIEYKKAGVIVMGLVPNNRTQLNIFEKENPKHQALMKTLDFIAKKEGPSKVKLASQDLKRIWKMKQTKLSLRYTTELNETISIKG